MAYIEIAANIIGIDAEYETGVFPRVVNCDLCGTREISFIINFEDSDGRNKKRIIPIKQKCFFEEIPKEKPNGYQSTIYFYILELNKWLAFNSLLLKDNGFIREEIHGPYFVSNDPSILNEEEVLQAKADGFLRKEGDYYSNKKDKGFKITTKVYALLVENGRILLLHRPNNKIYDGKCGLPGGHLEAGESPRDALIREVEEETGVRLDVHNIKFAHTMYRDKNNGEQRIYLFFKADKWTGEPVNNEPEKCVKIEWAKMDDIPENIVPLMEDSIFFFLMGVDYGEIFY